MDTISKKAEQISLKINEKAEQFSNIMNDLGRKGNEKVEPTNQAIKEAADKVLEKTLIVADKVFSNTDKAVGASMFVASFGTLALGTITFLVGIPDPDVIKNFYQTTSHLKAEIASAGIAAMSYLNMSIGKNIFNRKDILDKEGFNHE